MDCAVEEQLWTVWWTSLAAVECGSFPGKKDGLVDTSGNYELGWEGIQLELGNELYFCFVVVCVCLESFVWSGAWQRLGFCACSSGWLRRGGVRDWN